MRDRFEIREEIARDDVSVVYRAFDRTLQREVALKRLVPEAARDERISTRLVREARAVAQVRSAHVLAVYEVGADEAGPFLCIEPARGETLRERVARLGPLGIGEVVQIGLDLCDALASIHRARIVHRNVGLDQVFLDETGGVRLTGFALAKPSPGAPRFDTTIGQTTVSGRAARGARGTYAPEEAHGETLDSRSDLFALGVLLAECLTGVGPADAPEPGSFPDPNMLRALRPDLPQALEAALRRALAFFPNERFASAADFASALRAAPSRAPAAAAPAPTAPARSGRFRSRPLFVGATAAAAVLLVALGFWFLPGTGSALRGIAGVSSGGDRDATGRRGRRSDEGAEYRPGYERHHALVVGIDKYADSSWKLLSTAVEDARAVADFLVKEEDFPKENVTLLLGKDATKQAIVSQLRDRFSDKTRVGANDRVVFYFAGHGDQREAPFGPRGQVGYLVPHDGTQERSTHILHTEIQAACDETPAKHFLLLLDCCFAGLVTMPTMRGQAESPEIAANMRKHVRQVLTAGEPGQLVADQLAGTKGHSPFTYFLLKGLAGGAAQPGKDWITATMLAEFVHDEVVKLTDRQTPTSSRVDGIGNFVFQPKSLRKAGASEAAATRPR